MITTKKRSYKRFYALGILVVMAFASYPILQHYLTPQEQLRNMIDGVTVGLDVKAYHAGQTTPYAHRYLPNDLVLDNFNNFLKAFFGQTQTDSQCASVKNVAGTTNNLNILYFSSGTCSSASSIWGFEQTNNNCDTIPYCGGRITIGTGSSVSRTDFKLQTQYNSDVSVSTSICNAGATDNDAISASVPITSTVGIQEAGLDLMGSTQSGNYNGPWLMFHDSFTTINAVNGDTVTVTYTINWNNAGFNFNICTTFAAIFTGSINAANYAANVGVSVTLTKTGGGTNTFYVWCNKASGAITLWATTSSCGVTFSTNNAYIAIGTGTTAFTPTSTQLNTQLATSTITTYQYSSTNGQVYWSTSFNIGTTNTITEAGLFNTINSNNYMFAAKTFTGQTETANTAWGITLQVTD